MCAYYGDLDINHDNVTFAQFGANKQSGKYPLGQLPCLTVGDSPLICQSGAIARYVAKLAGVYPEDALKALYVDEAYEVAEDVFTKAAVYMCTPEEKEVRKAAWFETVLPRLENFVSLRCKEGSTFIANNEFSVADIYFYVTFFMHITNSMIGFDLSKVESLAPAVWKYVHAVKESSEMKKALVKSDELCKPCKEVNYLEFSLMHQNKSFL